MDGLPFWLAVAADGQAWPRPLRGRSTRLNAAMSGQSRLSEDFASARRWTAGSDLLLADIYSKARPDRWCAESGGAGAERAG